MVAIADNESSRRQIRETNLFNSRLNLTFVVTR